MVLIPIGTSATSQGQSVWVELLPLWTALTAAAAGVLGAWFTARASSAAAKAQVRAGTVASTRIRWADELRTELAALGADCLSVATDIAAGKSDAQTLARFDAVNQRTMKAELLLDVGTIEAENLQEQLTALSDLIDFGLKNAFGGDEVSKIDKQVRSVIVAGRAVVVKEWKEARALV